MPQNQANPAVKAECPYPGTICLSGTFYPNQVWAYTNSPKKPVPPLPTLAPHEHIDVVRGLWQGIFIGFGTPFFTRPIEKVQVIIVTSADKFSWTATVSCLTKEPYKGLVANLAVNTVRRSIVFATMPFAQNYLQDNGLSATSAKTWAPAIAGVAEGILLAPYTVIDQRLQTGQASTLSAAWQGMSRQDFLRTLPIAGRMGAICGGAFWPIYCSVLNSIQNPIAIKNDSYVIKVAEEMLTGAAAGAVTSGFTFPLYTTMLRLIANPSLSVVDDYKNAAARFGKNILREHYYKNFSTGLVRIIVGMSVVNTLKYGADSSYDSLKKNRWEDKCNNAYKFTLFHQRRQSDQANVESQDIFLQKMMTC